VSAAAETAVAARPLVDSHCHLDYLERDGDIEPVVARALSDGVGTLVTFCTKLCEFVLIEDIAHRFPRVFCWVGVHPHEAGKEGQETADKLIELAGHDKVVGIGETGLDYYYEHSPREAQKVSFRSHIEAARETGLPLIVHARDADDDTVAMLKEEHAKGPFPGVIHCFTAGPELAAAALQIGFYISLAGIVTFKSAEALRATVADVPLDRLLVETDSPYLAPVPKRGKTNEPANVVYTADALAKLCGVEVAEFADMTTDNFFRLFTRAARP
jgi:TatD DNase family protein